MEIDISVEELKDSLFDVLDSVDMTQSEPKIIRNLLFETKGEDGLIITATDLSVMTTSRAKCDVKKSGKLTIPGKFLSKILTVTKDKSCLLSIKGSDGNGLCTITTESGSKYTVYTSPSSEFPAMCEFSGETFEILANTLSKMLAMTVYATSVDETRRKLCGVNISFDDGILTVVATDGKRLSCASKKMDCALKRFSATIPLRYCSILIKSLKKQSRVYKTIRVTIGRDYAKFEADDGFSIQTKLIDEAYPDVRHVLPNSFKHEVEINRDDFLTAVTQASVPVTRNGHINIKIGDGLLCITGESQSFDFDNSPSSARAMVPVDYNGDEFIVLLSHIFLMDVLNSIYDESIKLRFNTFDSPVEIGNSFDFCFRGIIMPLRS